MKSLVLALTMFVGSTVFAGQVELGKYRAVDADTKTIIADLELRANGTANLMITTPDFKMPAPGCEGKYKIQGNKFSADVKCPTDLLPEASVTIDVTNVNPQSVRSPEGARVDVIIDALGEEATTFMLKKRD